MEIFIPFKKKEFTAPLGKTAVGRHFRFNGEVFHDYETFTNVGKKKTISPHAYYFLLSALWQQFKEEPHAGVYRHVSEYF